MWYSIYYIVETSNRSKIFDVIRINVLYFKIPSKTEVLDHIPSQVTSKPLHRTFLHGHAIHYLCSFYKPLLIEDLKVERADS